jgi:type I restriction-modification system DNA methylase subunit
MEKGTQRLQKSITSIYNHLYANSEKKTPHGISKEVGKILHTGMYLEECGGLKIAFSYEKAEEKKYLNFESSKFAKEIHAAYKKMNSEWNIYDGSDDIKLKDFDIAYTCVQLNGIKLTDPHKDVFGDALEIFRSQWAKQVGGQFFTDSLVTRLSMKLLEFDPTKGDDLIDICSGTGGFLLAGLNHIKEILETKSPNSKSIEKKTIELARKSLRGQEFDKEVCSIANSTLNSRIGSSELSFVSEGDSLECNVFNSKASQIQFDKHKCVAGNPPFGTKITIKDLRILENFELARVKARQNEIFPSKLTSRAPDILFLEQNIKLLVPGEGRLSIVVPYQILSGPQTLYIRQWLLLQTEILSIVDLPAETFQPHTGTKGCLLTLRRRKEPLDSIEEIEDYEIFMSAPKWIGHDRRGNPVFKRDIDGAPTGEILTDFPELEAAYKSFKNGKDFKKLHEDSFTIKISEILNSELLQLNAQFHKPNEFRSNEFDDSAWERERLNDLIKKIFYPGRFSRGYVEHYDGAIPFFGGKEIIQMVTGSTKYIPHNHPKLKELVVKKGWILITRSGTTGIVSCVPEAWDGYAMSEHVIRLIPNEERIDPFYLLAFLKTDYGQDQIAKGVYGSVIDSITPDFIGNIEILIPKDKDLYKKIIKLTKEAEDARNQSLLKNADGQSILNAALGH